MGIGAVVGAGSEHGQRMINARSETLLESHQFKTREPFAFPELWDCWIDLDTRKPLYSFTIIPTHATALDADYATIAALVMSWFEAKT